jgi:hypothetical protein
LNKLRIKELWVQFQLFQKPQRTTRFRVNWPIIECLPMTKHFGRSFSILVHFEWFKML